MQSDGFGPHRHSPKTDHGYLASEQVYATWRGRFPYERVLAFMSNADN